MAGPVFIGSCSEECVECVLQLRCPAGVHLGHKEEEDLGELQACSETKPGQGIQGWLDANVYIYSLCVMLFSFC